MKVPDNCYNIYLFIFWVQKCILEASVCENQSLLFRHLKFQLSKAVYMLTAYDL